MDRFQPPPETAETRAFHERERKHFIFAMVLILGVVIALPVAGAIAVWLGFFDAPQ